MKKYKISYSASLEFELIGNLNESVLEGRFNYLNDASKARLMELEDESDGWYLDDSGYRLSDEELFKASPWMLIDDQGKRIKMIQRFLDGENGEVKFLLQPLA